MPKLENTIVVPTYNEADNIPELVRRIKNCVDACILVMDDSPNGDTAKVAKEMGCTVVRRTGDKGLAPALADGFALASDSKKVVMMDADLQHPPELLPAIFRELDNYDLVIASRYTNGGSAASFSFTRKMVSSIANLLALPIAYRVKDRMTGFCGFNPRILDGVVLNRRSWKIPLDIMAKGHYRTVTEVPYTFGERNGGESKLNNKIIVEYIKQLVPLYWVAIKRMIKRG